MSSSAELKRESVTDCMSWLCLAKWYEVKPDLLHRPWGEACTATQRHHPAIDFKVEANSKVRFIRMEFVTRSACSDVHRDELRSQSFER